MVKRSDVFMMNAKGGIRLDKPPLIDSVLGKRGLANTIRKPANRFYEAHGAQSGVVGTQITYSFTFTPSRDMFIRSIWSMGKVQTVPIIPGSAFVLSSMQVRVFINGSTGMSGDMPGVIAYGGSTALLNGFLAEFEPGSSPYEFSEDGLLLLGGIAYNFQFVQSTQTTTVATDVWTADLLIQYSEVSP